MVVVVSDLAHDLRSDPTTAQVWLLTQQFLDEVPVDVSEPTTGAIVVVGQLLVIDAELMQDGGVEVGPGDR